MNDYESILFEAGGNGVFRIVLNRPDTHNLLTSQMMKELQDALSRVHRDSYARALILTASGKAFCPGIGRSKGDGPAPKRIAALPIDATIPRLLYTMPIPTIAAVNGACAGVGLGMACACDFRLCVPEATFRSAFLSVGLAGDMGLPWLLGRIVGAGRAREISFLDQKITAMQARDMGLVSQVVDAADFGAEVDRLAAKFADGPQLANRALKSHYLAAERLDFVDFLDIEFQRHFHLAATEDFEEGWKSLLERREPMFSRGRPAETSPRQERASKD